MTLSFTSSVLTSEVVMTSLQIETKNWYVHGNTDFVIQPWMQETFQHSPAKGQGAAFNSAMIDVQESVEWYHKKLNLQFTISDFSRPHQAGQDFFGPSCKPSTVLWISRICIRNVGQSSMKFKCSHLTLQLYLQQITIPEQAVVLLYRAHQVLSFGCFADIFPHSNLLVSSCSCFSSSKARCFWMVILKFSATVRRFSYLVIVHVFCFFGQKVAHRRKFWRSLPLSSSPHENASSIIVWHQYQDVSVISWEINNFHLFSLFCHKED